MAEQVAKGRKKEAELRLQLSLTTLSGLLDGADELRPTELKLSRQLASTKAIWESYDRAHFSHYAMLEPEEGEEQQQGYAAQYKTVQDLLERAEDLLEERRAAVLDEQPPQRVDVKVLYGIAKQEQVGFYASAKDQVATVATCLEPAADETVARKVSKQELDELTKELDQALVNMQAAALLTKEMTRLNPTQAEENVRIEAETVLKLRRDIDKQRRLIASKLALVAAPEAASGARGNRMGNETYMYQRRPMPKFDGQRRNYPAFKREWQTGITGRFDPDYEVREMKLNVPAEVEPDIKNLTTMAEMWGVLDARYGKVMELTRELISGLQRFTFSKQATTNGAKFLELHREWVKVYNDLSQINCLSVLDHQPTLCTLAGQLPGDDSKMRYTMMRRKWTKENEAAAVGEEQPAAVKTEIDLMNEFMREEREIQVSFDHLVSPESIIVKSADNPRTSERVTIRSGGYERCYKCDMPGHKPRDCPSQYGGGGGRRIAHHCYRCNEEGHDTSECTSGFRGGGGRMDTHEAISHANTSIKPKDCPACLQQHSFTTDDGAVRYKCRLSSCPTFRDVMSPSERANLVEKIKGCALCTDWTSSHRREQCEEKNKAGHKFSFCREESAGGRCGQNHHILLHGATNKFSNFVKRDLPAGPAGVLAGQLPRRVRENLPASALGRADPNKPIKMSDMSNKEMGASQPRRYGSCTNRQQCFEANVKLSRKEQEELTLIESKMVLNENTKQVAKNLEGRVGKAGQLEAYNAEMEGYVHRSAFKELSEEELSFKEVNKVQEPDAKLGKAKQKFWRPWEEVESKEVVEMKVQPESEEKAVKQDYAGVVKSGIEKRVQTVLKDPIKEAMLKLNEEEEEIKMSFVFEEKERQERESVEVRKKAQAGTLNIKDQQRRFLLERKERLVNVIKCEERVSKAGDGPPQLQSHHQERLAAGVVAGSKAEKWVVVRRKRSRYRW